MPRAAGNGLARAALMQASSLDDAQARADGRIENGFKGLINGEVTPLSWMDVDGWASKGGSKLGSDAGPRRRL